MRIVFDTETTTKNKGNPFTKSNRLIAYSILKDDTQETYYYDEPGFYEPLQNLAENGDLIIGFNLKFDLHWARRSGFKLPNRVKIWDCQLAQFIILGQSQMYPSLNDSLAYFGLPLKKDAIAEYWALGINTDEIPRDELLEYVAHDVHSTSLLEKEQRKVMTPQQIRLCEIMGLDLLTLLDMEQAGIKLNREKCQQKLEECSKELTGITSSIYNAFDDIPCNLDSGHHLSALLFGGPIEHNNPTYEELIYKSGAKKGMAYQKAIQNITIYDCPGLFKPDQKNQSKQKIKIEGRPEHPVYYTNEEVLKSLSCRNKVQKTIVELLLKRAELTKLISTYYGALPKLIDEMEWEDDFIHGSYNQCVAATGRLSSSKPNMQNFSADVDELLVSRYE